jgi:hypothetical protein
MIRTGGLQSIGTVDSPLPLPSLATIITGTVDFQTLTETFVPHIFSQHSTISGIITTTTTLTSGGSPVAVVVGPSGVGWVPYHEPSGAPELLPPSIFPPIALAAANSANFIASGVSDALVPLEAGLTSPSVPLGTGISTSGPSATIYTYHDLMGTGSSIPKASINTGIRAPSLSSSQIPFGTGITGSSLSGIGFRAQSL